MLDAVKKTQLGIRETNLFSFPFLSIFFTKHSRILEKFDLQENKGIRQSYLVRMHVQRSKRKKKAKKEGRKEEGKEERNK